MLAENKPDKRATHAIVIERVQGLTLRGLEVDWDDETPEPGLGSALVMREVGELLMSGFRGRSGSRDPAVPSIQKAQVKEVLP
jgi:hypothetical protein